jgi:hypothetical protein
MNLLEQVLLQEDYIEEDVLSFFSNRFYNTDFRTIHKHVNIFEVFALYENLIILNEILSKKEEDVQNLDDLISDYLLESINYYLLEDTENYLDVLEETVAGKVASSAASTVSKISNSKYTRMVKDFFAGKVSEKTLRKNFPHYNQDIDNIIKQNGLTNASDIAFERGELMKTLRQSIDTDISNELKNKATYATDPFYRAYYNVRQKLGGGETHRRPVRAVTRTAAAVGTVPAYKYATTSAGDTKKAIKSLPDEVLQTTTVQQSTTPSTNTQNKKKILAKYTEIIKNNPGKSLAGLGIASGLGYLAYKLWKNKKNKKESK